MVIGDFRKQEYKCPSLYMYLRDYCWEWLVSVAVNIILPRAFNRRVGKSDKREDLSCGE